MNESFFGTVSPVWAGAPAAGFGWGQVPPAPAVFNAPVGAPAFPTQPLASGFGVLPTPNANLQASQIGGAQPLDQQAFARGTGVATPQSSPATVPYGLTIAPAPLTTSAWGAFIGPEIVHTVTAPTLLAAVAARRGQPFGPTNDQEIEDLAYDALDFLPGTNEVEVRCDAGRITLTGSVQQKRLKRDLGEIAWAIPGVNDLQNNITIVARRRPRGAGREAEAPSPGTGRKQS